MPVPRLGARRQQAGPWPGSRVWKVPRRCGHFLGCRGRAGGSGCLEGQADPASGPRRAGSHGVTGKKGVSGRGSCQGCCWAVAQGQTRVTAPARHPALLLARAHGAGLHLAGLRRVQPHAWGVLPGRLPRLAQPSASRHLCRAAGWFVQSIKCKPAPPSWSHQSRPGTEHPGGYPREAGSVICAGLGGCRRVT